MLSEFAEMIIARTDLDPRIRHADERLLKVIILKAASAKHGACAGAACTVVRARCVV